MAHNLTSILDECLAALSQGESLEVCLDRYPQHAEELRTLLLLTQRLSLTPRHEPRPGAQSAAWQQFRARAEDMRLGRRPQFSINIGWMRPLAIATAVVLAILVAGGGTIYASQDALPDSPLYRVKLATEEVRLWFVFDDVHEAEILLDQSNERTNEIKEMVSSGKPLSGNVLTALRVRNARAVRILENHPDELVLLSRANEQSATQESLLLALWRDLAESARGDYAETVATLHNAQLRTTGKPGSVTPDDLASGVINIAGVAEPAAKGLWLFGGVEVRLDDGTFGKVDDLEPGKAVQVIAAKGANGRLLALNVAVTESQQPEQEYVVSGALEEVGKDEVVIGGQRIAITEKTLLKLKLLLGQQVEIKVEDVGGQAVAASVEEGSASDPAEETPALMAYEGVIEEEINTADATDDWLVGGQHFLVTPDTELDAQTGALAEGARARVEAVTEGGELVAKRVVVLADEPEDEQGEADTIRVEGVFEAEDEGNWKVGGVEVEAPADVETPEVGSLITMEGRREGDAIVGGHVLATFAPEREGFLLLRGRIRQIGEDGFWQVGLAPVQVGEDTVIVGEPQEGSRVFIWATRDDEDSLQAIYVNVIDPRPLVVPTPTPPPQD
jgi:hypothetical protein